jgi:DNA mismatch repair protein MutL
VPIHKLPPDVAAKIAAGEVVERPASVVKELIENAIDARAGTIRVEVVRGGKRLLKVSDDGLGISADEVPLAFERHATSKLTTIEDLFQVKTLGFRGEALASVAAVSQLNMITRPADQTTGVQIRFEGGRQKALDRVGAPGGTIITVENLFYNVPARLKFLKADATEMGHIHRIVSHYALAYPEIRFSLFNAGRQVFQTSGSGDLYDVLVSVWGLAVARQMVEVEGETGRGINVYGYVGTPALHRGQRDYLVLFVNRRWIQDKALAHAVAQAYHTFLPVGRHPVAVLNVILDSAEVDVNVHPTKAEVKFREPGAVFTAVQRPVRATITEHAPMARPAQVFGAEEERWSGGGHAGDFNRGADFGGWSQLGLEAQRTGSQEEAFPLEPAGETAQMPPLRVVGQIQQMYVIAEGPDGLYLIDQHAAHERVLYEKLMAQKEAAAVVSQRLLTPALLELTPAQAAVLEAEQEALTTVGFELEPFGGHSYRLLAVPEMLATEDLAEAFLDILTEMAEGAIPMARQTHERVAVIVCKRASIKGGQTLSHQEMAELVRQLEQSQNPRTCPHGRPTMVHLSAYQLAREFGRH